MLTDKFNKTQKHVHALSPSSLKFLLAFCLRTSRSIFHYLKTFSIFYYNLTSTCYTYKKVCSSPIFMFKAFCTFYNFLYGKKKCIACLLHKIKKLLDPEYKSDRYDILCHSSVQTYFCLYRIPVMNQILQQYHPIRHDFILQGIETSFKF